MLYTIGFTQTSAAHFFGRLTEQRIETLIDVRLNNRSQLAGFAKYPDVEWFLDTICRIRYQQDTRFAPTEDILHAYQKKEIDWAGYEERFHALMRERDIAGIIHAEYAHLQSRRVCFLCSEPTAGMCHRRLVAEYFSQAWNCEIQHL